MPLSRSSGAYVSEASHSMACDECNFEGFVEVWSDYQILASGFTCPEGHENELPWDWDEDDPDRDRD